LRWSRAGRAEQVSRPPLASLLPVSCTFKEHPNIADAGSSSSRENIAYTARDASGNATVLRYIAIKSSRKSHIQAHISATKLPRHPSLVEHREAFVWKNAFWIAMEDVPWSLDDVLARTPSFLESHIAYVTAQVVSGLLVLHKLNMVHRDIKSFNIRIGFQGQVKIGTYRMISVAAAFLTIGQPTSRAAPI
jgi:serine/threonine protein kinase